MGSSLAETNRNLDEMVDLALELQQETGIRLLWATCNLFAHPMYACGAITNPDAHVVAMAAAQVKKGLEVAKKLGAEGFGRWAGCAESASPCRPQLGDPLPIQIRPSHCLLALRVQLLVKGI